MRILVTGAAGYLGQVLVPRLLRAGYHVTALDTYPHGTPLWTEWCSDPGLDPVRGDARDVEWLRRLIVPIDVILPFAALVGAPRCDGDEAAAITTNTDAIRTLLGLTSPDQAVIFPATDSGYGTSVGICTEESPLNPVSLYARTKHEAEMAVLDHGGVTLRLASVFGMAPQMRLDLMVNDFTWRAVTDRSAIVFEPDFMRNFVHVQDVAGAFIHAITHYADMQGKPYNVGNSAARMTKLQLCAKISGYTPFRYIVEEERSDPDRRNCIVSNERIEATGWRAQHSIDDGIAELIKGYRMMRDSRWRNG